MDQIPFAGNERAHDGKHHDLADAPTSTTPLLVSALSL